MLAVSPPNFLGYCIYPIYCIWRFYDTLSPLRTYHI
nr:MAG TPA: hypothetical protein [Bacteriophage sp.]